MSKEKSPAFQFYPRDWISDEKVMSLSFEQEGWYIHLICHCWLEGSIPSDPAEALKLVGIRQSDLRHTDQSELLDRFNQRYSDMEELLKLCFKTSEAEPQRSFNNRVEKERRAQEDRRKERAESGKRGGKSSAKKRMQNPSSAWKQLQANSSSSSSSSITSSNIPPVVPQGTNGLDKLFVKFWDSYPRHESKAKAYQSFAKIHPSPELVDWMVKWLAEACQSEQWQDKSLVPFAQTWLNQRRWEGDPPPKAIQVTKQSTFETVEQHNRRIIEEARRQREQQSGH